jgi:Raf kinase inhibitor-like YbhB/YbcL family protein
MKRYTKLSILLVLFTFAIVGCGSDSPAVDDPVEPTSEPPAATAPPEQPVPTEAPEEEAAPLSISTSAFEPDGPIPVRYSCLGDNKSPELAWSGVPEGAESLVLLMYDLDAGAESGASTPQGFAHWVVYNIPPSVGGFAEDMPAGEVLESGGEQGSNDFAPFATAGELFPGGGATKIVGYDGPCPGSEHRYAFEVFAMDTMLDLPAGASMGDVLAAMEGHVIAQADVVGNFDPDQ